MPKNAQTTAQLHSSHNAIKAMLKILQARLQQYVNRELPDVQAGFRKGRGPMDTLSLTKEARVRTGHGVLASAAHILKLERYRED